MKYLPNLRLKLILVFFIGLMGLVYAATWATGGFMPANAQYGIDAGFKVIPSSTGSKTKPVE